MKRFLLIIACILNAVWASAQFSGSGTGTESDPYLIFNPIQLNQVRNFLSNNNVYFKLMADIDLNEWIAENSPNDGWLPIGSTNEPFMGSFDGNNHTIKGLSISRLSSNYVGFFAYSSGRALIKNVSIYGNVSGLDNVGGICGYVNGVCHFENVHFYGTVSGGENVGGFCGSIIWPNNLGGGTNYVTTKSCSFTGDVIGNGQCVAGLVGNSNHIIIDNCVSKGQIFGTSCVGGLIGGPNQQLNLDQAPYFITNSGAITDIIATGDYVGGIVGTLYGFGQINNCYSIGSIISAGSRIGGIVGLGAATRTTNVNVENGCSISNVYHLGSITGYNSVGGIIGFLSGGNLTNSYCSGEINGNQYVGGIAGIISKGVGSSSLKTTLYSSISISKSISAISTDVGRIYGKKNEASVITIGTNGSSKGNLGLATSIIRSVGIAQQYHDDQQNGSSIGLSTLKIRGTYQGLGWDFTNDWSIQDTECFPYHISQTAPPMIENGLYSGSTSVSGKSVDGGTVFLKHNGNLYSTNCLNNEWTIITDPLQAGVPVFVYSETPNKVQSYLVESIVSFSGNGTSESPYLIYSSADLAAINGTSYYKLMKDIDLTDYINTCSPDVGWIPIGKSGSIAPKLDGNGHTISGLWINSTEDNVGLFSISSGIEIKNLTLEIAPNNKIIGGNNTGALIGKIQNGKIENCFIKGDVSGTNYVGGISGWDYSTQYNGNKVIGNITGSQIAGGVIGFSEQSSVSEVCFDGTVTVSSENSIAGGIIGHCKSTVSMCHSSGFIKASGTKSIAGGLIGNIEVGNLSDSYSSAEITSVQYSGGVVGVNSGTVERCHASGDIYSTYYGGGVIGYNDGSSSIVRNCVANNENIYITDETGYASRTVGGLKNGASLPEMNNYAYNSMVVSVNNIPQKIYDDNLNGSAKTIESLKSKSMYHSLGWDFENVWDIDEGTGYPYLKFEKTEPEYIIGDVTGDGNVSVADAAGAVSIILNEDVPNLNRAAADVTGEGEISVADVAGIVNIILGGDASSVKARETNIGHSDPSIALNCYDGTLAMSLSGNADEFTAIQFDMALPEGMSLKTDAEGYVELNTTSRTRKHLATAAQMEDGSWRVICYSLDNRAMAGAEGEVLTFQIERRLSESNADINVKNIELVRTDMSVVHPTGLRYSFSEATSIEGVYTNDDAKTIYNLNGQKLNSLNRGINIVNGNKIYIK